jgi:hypothetical protein
MARSDDVKAIREKMGSNCSLIDLTPTPLTATGPGEWVRYEGKTPGFAQAFLSDTTTPTATVQIECTNDPLDLIGCLMAPVDAMSGAKATAGATTFSGPIWVRINVLAISGSGASVTGLLSRS